MFLARLASSELLAYKSYIAPLSNLYLFIIFLTIQA